MPLLLMIVMCIKLVLEAAISFRAAPKAIHIAFSQFAAVKDPAIKLNRNPNLFAYSDICHSKF
jgi:hypothetical protein